jgi:hypothetical protein
MLDRSPKAFAEAGRQLSRQLVEHIERYAAIYGANRKCPVEDALQKKVGTVRIDVVRATDLTRRSSETSTTRETVTSNEHWS